MSKASETWMDGFPPIGDQNHDTSYDEDNKKAETIKYNEQSLKDTVTRNNNLAIGMLTLF